MTENCGGDDSSQPHRIAIVGMGVRLPGDVTDAETYWALLSSAESACGQLPEDRQDGSLGDWTGTCTTGGFLSDAYGFDAPFFDIGIREARAIDPQHRLCLEVAWEALEDAGLPPSALAETTVGVYVGTTTQDYFDLRPEAPDAYWAVGNGHCFAAGRLAYTFGFTGPALSIDTACSSSLVAVHSAARSLRGGECDVAVAGGVNLILSPTAMRFVQRLGALSPDGTCRSFDAGANGFVRGEGCCFVILKRLSDAVQDGDRIHAVIEGSAINHDGNRSTLTAPNVRAQVQVIRSALADARIEPGDLGLVEAHGTGTPKGDPIEMAALAAAVGEGPSAHRLLVGTVKPVIGHAEAAAGIAGLIKLVLCIKQGRATAIPHFGKLNPRIDLNGSRISIVEETREWGRGRSPSYGGVSAFGMSGTNAHVILGPAPHIDSGSRSDEQVRGFELSGKSIFALQQLARRYRNVLAHLDPKSYGAFAYTASAGRARHVFCATVRAERPDQAVRVLDSLVSGAGTALVREIDPGGSGPSAVLGAELPRRIIDLPHYPWEHARYLPTQTASPVQSRS
ncbi:beta-ketoacyl synthase N-terminal-like domain-containing protein [Nocardia asteroides]|uniref:beta-ketoacyl synthase N-terminal-like domain-containing protein n=1 Tax=Nocardia asteroides TaxID=1824 RepID=UPI001E5F99E4|nr:polyketide synthase [Nocardia asteroides]UGT61031.1 polyketide synthase [Nocardia asteroides]